MKHHFCATAKTFSQAEHAAVFLRLSAQAVQHRYKNKQASPLLVKRARCDFCFLL